MRILRSVYASHRPATVRSLACATLAAASLSACAATHTGPPRQESASAGGLYAKLYAGTGILEDADIDFIQGGADFSGEGSFGAGLATGFAVGYAIDENWSVEVDYAYRSNDLDQIEEAGTTVGADGDFASTVLMLNGVYRFDTGSRWTPYVGLGFGTATEVDIDIDSGAAAGSYSDNSPAAQFFAGAGMDLTEDLDAYAELRFTRIPNPEMRAETGSGVIESEYGHLALLFGLQYSF